MLRLFSLLISIALFFSHSLQAQPKKIVQIAAACSEKKLKEDLYYLASDAMEGRLIGTHGDTLASRFIATCFNGSGLTAPYNGTYFQSVSARKKIVHTTLQFGVTTHKRYDGWSVYPQTPVDLKNVAVIYNQFNTINEISNYINQHEVNGKVVVVSNALMKMAMNENIIDSVEAIWKKRGIVAVVWYGPGVNTLLENTKRYLLLPEYENKELDEYQHMPADDDTTILHELSLTPERMNELLEADNISVRKDGSFTDSLIGVIELKTRISLSFTVQYENVVAPNVIGILPGRDTSLPCIVISAHHDHQGRQPNGIYYGAVDNASGTVSVLEIAAMMHKAVLYGYRPRRTIVFASFTGEEKGMLGSFYYVAHPVYPMSRTWGVMNIDMMGRVDTFYSGKRADSNYAYILVMDSVKGFRKSLYNANRVLPKLKLDTYYERPENMQRRLIGSDQFPFYLKGVPFVRIDCGFAKDYHLPTDTPDKINYKLLTRQTQLAFLSLWNMAED